MSGYKRATVTISEEEYRRLHQADMKQRFRERKKALKKKAAPTADLTNAIQEMETRQEQFEVALGELNEGLGHSQTATLQEIFTHNAAYYEQLMALIQETTRESNEAVASATQQFTEEIQREREQYRQGIQSLVQQLDTYEQREAVKVEAARRWLRQSVAMSDLIHTQFEHERFAPGKLSQIQGSLNLAQDNLAQGFFEASLQTSQQAFLQLSGLHLELEQCVAEWHSEYQKAYSALDGFIDELELNAAVNAFGLGGEELPEQVDVAYWSNGQYALLLEKARELLRLLEQDQRHIPTAELTRTHRELLPVIQERFESIVYEARLRALNSQLRMNIAETALQALEIHGFTLHGAGYENEDMRAPFTAQLGNADGSRVTIQIMPSQKATQELTNELIVITNHPYLKTEHEARLQWEELSRSLSQYDLQVSRPTVSAVPPMPLPEQTEVSIAQTQQPTGTKRFHNVR
ncbi:MAG TPA: hypothetical protein VK897_24895 [Anaerolineales bacterium]|nr:hypothetical protein [Anaerolineales bacterium]